ncbi:MAG: hypothetical protein WB660_05900 [Candidatus Sulfotelmatobacter sp.]
MGPCSGLVTKETGISGASADLFAGYKADVGRHKHNVTLFLTLTLPLLLTLTFQPLLSFDGEGQVYDLRMRVG